MSTEWKETDTPHRKSHADTSSAAVEMLLWRRNSSEAVMQAGGSDIFVTGSSRTSGKATHKTGGSVFDMV